MAKGLRITSKHHGFRRAGLVHPETAVDHRLDSFTKEQIGLLKGEPMLVIEEIEMPDDAKGKSKEA